MSKCFTTLAALSVVLICVHTADAKKKVEWRQVFTKTGTIVNTSTVLTGQSGQLPQNGKLPGQSIYVIVRPVKINFTIDGSPYFRIRWDTEATQDKKSQMRVELWKNDKRGSRTKLRKVSTLGRVRGGTSGGKILTLGKASYMLKIVGSNIKYTFIVEEAHKAGSSSSSDSSGG